MAKATPSPYVPKPKQKQNMARHTIAIPADVMLLVDRWAERENREGRPCQSRNDAANRIILDAVREFIQPNTKKENGSK